jgi:hypothetical protein
MREHGSYEKAIALIKTRIDTLNMLNLEGAELIKAKTDTLMILNSLIEQFTLEIEREIHEEERRA